jgi:hypothetical protein
MNTYPTADDDLTREVWRAMMNHKGRDRRIDREELTYLIFGKVTKSKDRKVRDALSNLPVVWDQGYFVPTSHDEAEGYRNQMTSRIRAIRDRLEIVDGYLRTQREPERVEQPALLEMTP